MKTNYCSTVGLGTVVAEKLGVYLHTLEFRQQTLHLTFICRKSEQTWQGYCSFLGKQVIQALSFRSSKYSVRYWLQNCSTSEESGPEMKGGNRFVVISDVSAYGLEGLHSESVTSRKLFWRKSNCQGRIPEMNDLGAGKLSYMEWGQWSLHCWATLSDWIAE